MPRLQIDCVNYNHRDSVLACQSCFCCQILSRPKQRGRISAGHKRAETWPIQGRHRISRQRHIRLNAHLHCSPGSMRHALYMLFNDTENSQGNPPNQSAMS